MASGNGNTARKAVITSAIGLAFTAFTWGVNNIVSRVAVLESEAFRVGKIAAGRGERIESLERSVRNLMVDVAQLRVDIASRRQPSAWQRREQGE